jgi:phosphatidylinositol dimannoside acyltransferase
MADNRDGIGLTGYKLASVAAQNLPEAFTSLGATMLGAGFAQGMRGRRDTVSRHLQRVKGPTLRGIALRQAVQSSFDSYARYWVESFRLPGLTAAEIDAGFSYEHFGHIADGIDAGRGVILALPHLGGWEWAGRWLTERGYRVTVVVEPLEPPEVFEWFVGFRRSLGMTVVPLGPSAGSAVLRALRDNEIVCLLCDRDIQGGGVEVEFFGERTTLPAGPVTLAMRSGAPLVPCAVYFTERRNGHHAVVHAPVPLDRRGSLRDDVTRITQLLARELEVLIRAAPEQWHMFQPNWPSDPGYGS